jgi:hypothetical protein
MRRQGLHRHKKTCDYDGSTKDDIVVNQENDIVDNQEEDDTNYKELLIAMINDNKDLHQDNKKMIEMLAEMVPKIGNNNNSNNTTNNNNKFNLNVFLNEKCRDAMSIDEFIEGATVSLKNLEITKDKGFAEGIVSIFMDNINKLDIHERPIHCSDLKRDTIYIKNDEKWEKDEGHKKFGKAIGTISYKQVKSIGSWTDEYPDYEKSSAKTDEYIHLVRNCTQCPEENEQKIMKNVSKSILMPKTNS